MRTVDAGAIFVMYNFIIGVLLMLGSQQAARYAAVIGGGARARVERYVHLAVRTFGQTVAFVFGSIYFLLFILRLGVN